MKKLIQPDYELRVEAKLAPVIILGGIFTGIFTPTEALAIAFVYCLWVGFIVYRELGAKKPYTIVYEGGRTTGIVALELASGLMFSNPDDHWRNSGNPYQYSFGFK